MTKTEVVLKTIIEDSDRTLAALDLAIFHAGDSRWLSYSVLFIIRDRFRARCVDLVDAYHNVERDLIQLKRATTIDVDPSERT